MLKIEDIQKSLMAARKEAIRARLNLNNRSNWLQADSVAALLDMAKGYHDVLITIDEDDAADKGVLYAAADETFKFIANELANPSGFRQWLAHKDRGIIKISETSTPRSGKAASLVTDLLG